MTQTACSAKKFPAKRNLLGVTLKKNAGIIAIFLSLALLLCIYIGTTIASANPGYHSYDVYMSNYIREFTIIFITGACVLETLLAFFNFSYLYNKSATDMFHSLPISNYGLLLTRTLATYIGAATTWLAAMGAFWITSCLVCDKLVSAWIVLELMFNGLVIMLLYAAVLAFHAVISGNIVGYIFTLVATQVVIPLISLLLIVFAEEKLIGYSSNNFISDGSFANFSVMFKAIWIFVMRVSSSTKSDIILYKYILTVLIAVLLSVAIFAIATIIYNKRKSESAGQAFSFKPVKWFSVIVVTLLVGHVGGLLFSNGDIADFEYWIFSLVCSSIAAIVICAITDKGFQNIKKTLVSAAASVLVLVISFSSISIYADSYNFYVPKENDIKSVTVRIDTLDVDFALNLDKVTSLHRDIATSLTSGNEEYYGYRTIGSYFGGNSTKFEYELINGKKVKRNYYSANNSADSMLAIMKTDNYKKALTESRTYHTKVISLNDSGEYRDDLRYYEDLTNENMINIFEAYYKDIMNITNADFGVMVDNADFITVMAHVYNTSGEDISLSIPVCELFENTLAEIEYITGTKINRNQAR